MRVLWAFAFLLMLSGCVPAAKDRAAVRLAVGGAGQMVYLPVTLARELGYYDQEGLNVEFQDYPGGAKSLQSLLAGSADVVSGFYDHTIQMAAEGKPLRAFVVMLRYPGLALVVSPAASKRISSVADLAGATVGVTAPGSSTHLFLTYLLERHGVAAQRVSVTGIGHNVSAVAAMERGTVDAAVMTDPAISAIVRRAGPVRILADTRTEQGVQEALGVGMYPASVLYSTPAWLASHGNEARALARALQRTLAWMRQQNAAAIAGRLPASMRGEDAGLFEASLVASLGIFSVNGAMPEEGPAAVQRVLSLSLPKVRDTPVDLKSTFTNEYLSPNVAP